MTKEVIMSELKPGQNFDHTIPAVLQPKAAVVADATITEAQAEDDARAEAARRATAIEAEAEAQAEADRKAARAEEGRRTADAAYAAAASAESAASKAERATHDTIMANVAPPAPSPPPAAVTATPERRHADVEMLSISNFTATGQARHFLVDAWKRYGAKLALACVIAATVSGVVVAVGFGIFYSSNRAGYSPETLVRLTRPTTTNAPTMALPTPRVAPSPAPIPRGLLPPPVPARAEPGLQGARGSYVRTSARAAFPTSCATAGSLSTRLRGVRFFCGLQAGDDLCDCQVAGFVP
jgi:hypothetical protein